MINELYSSNLELIPLTREHAKLMFEGYCNENIYEYIESDIPESLEWLEEQFAVLEKREVISRKGVLLKLFDWVIFEKNTKSVVGRSEFTIYPDGDCNVAYVLFEEHWKKGYGFEATKLALEFVQTLNIVKRFQITCDTYNIGSRRIAEKLNFKYSHMIYGCNQLKDRVGDDYVFYLE